jgi:hypothetical protein
MQFAKLVKEYYDATVRARPGHVNTLSVSHSESGFYGTFLWARKKRCFRPGQVVPMPFNLIEHALDCCMKRHAQRRALRKGPEQAWGRHYTWPPSTLEQRLVMAVRKQRIRREMQGEKAKS